MDGLGAVRRLRSQWPEEHIVCVAITASGLLREPSFYLEAGFDDFIGKPFLFETVCECMARHLRVVLEPEPPAEMPASTMTLPADLGSVRLPGGLRKRLLAAAQINALTEIEAIVAEMKALDGGAQTLAVALERLLRRYDTDGIAALVARTSVRED
jgi:CheY-like chemotaxis protein